MDSGQFFEEAAGGNGYEAIKWKDKPIGTTVAGVIIDEPRSVTRKNLNTQEPEEQLPINLDTDGTEAGYRTLWVRKGFLAGAIKEACEKANVTGVAKGGKLGVKLTELRDVNKPQPAYVFEAKYEAPAAPTVDMDDIF